MRQAHSPPLPPISRLYLRTYVVTRARMCFPSLTIDSAYTLHKTRKEEDNKKSSLALSFSDNHAWKEQVELQKRTSSCFESRRGSSMLFFPFDSSRKPLNVWGAGIRKTAGHSCRTRHCPVHHLSLCPYIERGVWTREGLAGRCGR